MAAFAAMGKTTFPKNRPDIAPDIESINYARNYTDQHPDDEIAKGDTNWTNNPDYFANYIKDARKNSLRLIILVGLDRVELSTKWL